MNPKLLRLVVPLLMLSVAHAANKQGQFDARGNYSGTPTNLTLSAVVQPAPSDAGATGSVYVAAAAAGQLLFYGPKGWVSSTGGYPAYQTGPLANSTIPVLTGLDVSSLECAQVYAGYGRGTGDAGFIDLATNSTYGLIYQVPAKWPRTTPLACSAMTDADLARFLNQATFGATADEIANLKVMGIPAWLNAQFAAPATVYPDLPAVPGSAPASCDAICSRDQYSLFPMQSAFFRNMLSAPDQLRQRVAFALSQIFVISGTTLNLPYSFTPYQNILINNSFGNLEDILTQITLNPAMGDYLDMVNNGKPTSPSQQANENYARELMQLFSIGLYQLNQDGTQIKDAAGNAVPTYDQEMIKRFALVMTGWTYPPKPGATTSKYNPTYYLGDMVAVDSNHENTQKTLLNGFVLPAGQTAKKDLADAIHNIFMHPNVGPFIGKQLIQHLVTSNPSPAYVARVSAVFADNGQGVRGDLKAIVRAILLDPEARGGMHAETSYGHLKEPALFMAQLLRAINAKSDGVWLINRSSALGQNIYYSPTVFNYYPPDNTLSNGTGAPEFDIYNTSTALNRVNFLYSLLFSTVKGNVITPAAPDTTVTNSIGTFIDLSNLVKYAAQPSDLADQLNTLLLHGTMEPALRDVLIKQITAAGTDPLLRTQTALYLVATSSAFQVER